MAVALIFHAQNPVDRSILFVRASRLILVGCSALSLHSSHAPFFSFRERYRLIYY